MIEITSPLTLSAILLEIRFNELVTSALLVVGAGFCILASIGLARMPDLYMRMQTATKAGTLGVGCVMLGVGLHYRSLDVLVQCLLVVGFLFLTAPIASHLIARAAYMVRIRPWEGSSLDELAGCYDEETHTLVSTPDAHRADVERHSGRELHGDETMFGRPSDDGGPPRTA
ncbi:MAG: monovalent cation/H(+) antiporter subunit G [Planctomycetota bacterium]